VRAQISQYFSHPWYSTNLPESEARALAHYQSIGTSLSSHEIIVELRKELKILRDQANLHHFYYLVDGPSGIGKTQLPFSLSAGDDKLKICHLLMTPGETSSNQRIYNCFNETSMILQLCLKRDLKQIGSEGLGSEDLLYSDHHLWTVAFFFTMLGVTIELSTDFTVWSLRNFVEKMNPQDRPIFFLDEVLTHLEAKTLQLARNLLRSVGLVVVLMGTNSCTANLVTLCIFSQHRRGRPGLWCKLITNLPRSTAESLQTLGATSLLEKMNVEEKFKTLVTFLKNQFHSCLPWFIEVFVSSMSLITDWNELSAVDLMDRLFHHMAKIVYEDMRRIRTSGLRPQFCMHLDGHRRLNLDQHPPTALGTGTGVLGRSQTASFVANHFAVLDDGNIDLTVGQEGLACRGKDWYPFSSFVSAQCDPFPYLILGGGKGDFPLPFVDRKSNRMSTHQALISIETNHVISFGGTEMMIVNYNSNEESRDGAILEALSSVATELASHRNGLAGINIIDFILTLTEELLPTYRPLSWDPDHNLSHFLSSDCLEQTIPYLSPANDQWPEILQSQTEHINGCRTASMKRSPSTEQLDLNIPGWAITGECKNYEDPIPLEILRGILERIPVDSHLHLVFVPKIQENYFTETGSWSFFYHSRLSPGNICILKATVHDGTLRMEPLFHGSDSIPESDQPMVDSIPDLPHRLADRVLIVFPIESYFSQESPKDTDQVWWQDCQWEKEKESKRETKEVEWDL
jgi:hypothetical protein